MNLINDIHSSRRRFPHIFRRLRSLRGWTAASLLVTLLSCNGGSSNTPSQRVTLWRKDKLPYGTYIAYESLTYLFPNAEISVNRKDITSLSQKEGKKALIFIGHYAEPDPSDVNALLNFVGDGNHVFISAFHFSDTLLRALNVRPGRSGMESLRDSLRLSVYQPVTNDSLSYVYPGFSLDGWVDSLDDKYATVLGRDEKGRPDLIKFRYKGGGTLFLHFAPLAFSNYFLLHKQNKAYYDNVLSYIPGSVNEVIWDESFRYNRRKSFSTLSYIMSQPPFAWALGLLLLLLLLLYLFESKRRQRIVPLIAPLRNTSLDFVTTIGRLYYQRRDNQNLAVKMVTHFQDHIRTKYNMPVHLSDPAFVERLSYRTGIDKDFLQTLVKDILYLQQGAGVTDGALLHLNQKLDEFYKQA
ncbi:MAG TPA: DUF4350 domain-containing protein [Puia sp.]|nr:DUF4350 domain-containing protein [Puia sp.]